MIRRLLAAAALVAAVVLAVPAAASAHAQLEEVVPARGEVLERRPAQVEFRFDEPVEGSFGAVRVFDAAGERVDEGDAFHPGDARERIAVRLRPSLPNGTYTATYRVLSTDGHVVSGGSTFSIGEASGTGATVAELLEGTDAGPVTEVALGVAKGLAFAAIAMLVGGLGFLLWCWPRAAAEAGLVRVVSARDADELVAEATRFVVTVERLLGLPGQPTLPVTLAG